MTATCPSKKVERLISDAKSVVEAKFMTVHEAEKLLGLMESMRPVTPLAAFHYRNLQKQLLTAKFHKRVPSQIIPLTQASIADLVWWTKPTGFQNNCTANLREPIPNLHIWSDASMTGCGGHDSVGNHIEWPFLGPGC